MKTLLITCGLATVFAMPMVSTLQAQPPGFELRFGERGDREERGDPALFKALNDLEKARQHLYEARHGYGGRREAALSAVEEAIGHVRGMMRERGRF